jgi:hypothetical protein
MASRSRELDGEKVFPRQPSKVISEVFLVTFVNDAATDLSLTGAQFFDVSAWITLGAALLISTAAFVIMRLYVRATFRESQRSALLPQGGPGVEDSTLPPQPPTTGRLEIEAEKPGGPRSLAPPRSPTFSGCQNRFLSCSMFLYPRRLRRRACSFCLGSIPSRPHHRS